jgi:hypothetical protein
MSQRKLQCLGLVDDEAKKSIERVECRDIQISCIAAKSLAEPLEACHSQVYSAQVPRSTWQGHWARTPWRGLRSDVKSWVPKTGWQGYDSTPTSEGHASEAPK